MKIDGKFIIWAVSYLVLVVLLKWKLAPDILTVLFTLGVIIGLTILPILKSIVEMDPSPLEGVVAQFTLFLLTILCLTSTGNFIAKGVVLLLNWQYFYLARKEFLQTYNLANWFRQINMTIITEKSELFLIVNGMIILGETALFLLL